MITEHYVQAFYGAIYDRLSLSEKSNVRYVYINWINRLTDTTALYEEMQRACDWVQPA